MFHITILVPAVAAVSALALAPAASAYPVGGGSEGPAASYVVSVAGDELSPYAVPLQSLGGRSLAQYLAEHNEHRMSVTV
jgi:hypothetical protein